MPSIDGLVSGLNTTDIIRQLMQLERQPQARLQARQTVSEKAVAALRELNTKFLGISEASGKLTTGTGWQLSKASSSDDTRVTATATAGAARGSLTFSVEQLATAFTSLSAGAVASTADAVAAPDTSVFLTKGNGDPVEISTGNGSLAAVVSAVNQAGAGVTASAVQLTTGEYRLHLSSTTTGAASGVTLTDPAGGNPFATTLGPQDTLVAGQDAQLRVGTSTATRSTNTISDLLPGVTLNLTKAEPGVPVTVEATGDPKAVAARVGGLVDALNVALSDIKAVTGYNVESGNKGKLYGDGSIRGLRERLGAAVVGDGTTSAGAVGVSVTRDGTVVLDKDRLLKALADDPAAVEAALGGAGLAGRVHDLAQAASRSKTSADGPGLISNAIDSRERQISSLRTSIGSWDSRLELRERTLQRQYASLENALRASQSQGQWLAGQIAGLPSWGE